MVAKRKLNTSELAAYAGMSKGFFDKKRVFGGGPKYLKVGSRVVYDIADVDEWLAANRRTSTSDVASAEAR
ncbi:helix-turn-helix transcriptional regulator [Methylocella sp.]|uniref:helix-turn-helix transcriptional regulator n=1 Tax=Methylocella sp. TaxID=1978226 RepID=UPI003784B642